MDTELKILAKEIISKAIASYKVSSGGTAIYVLRRMNEELKMLKDTYELIYGDSDNMQEFKEFTLLK